VSFRIRTASLLDLEAVSALLLKSYSVLLQEAYEAAIVEKAVPLITNAQPKLLTSGTYYLADTEDGAIVGAGGWTKTSPTGKNETLTNGNIRHFGTDPDNARKGIGRALINRCIEDATLAGLTELNCYSTLNGERFYQACGFTSIETFIINLPGNVQFPSIRMTRAL
jgi:N-acetylglutamate synthase-like GNAT family acetyltransferase